MAENKSKKHSRCVRDNSTSSADSIGVLFAKLVMPATCVGATECSHA